jgi:hypothetical protein
LAKIVLISVGQPSTNPRLVKEANSFAEAGFEVAVIYSYWTRWASETDQLLFKKVNWEPILAGGSPFEDKYTYFFTRLRSKIFGYLAKKISFKFGIAEIARGRTYPELLKKAKQLKADLYIAHIQAALPAAVKAAKKNKAKCGFDAEDFHRQEVDDDEKSFYFRISKFIEDKYLPVTDYLTASSPLISEQYATLYNRKVITLLNAFPKTHLQAPVRQVETKPLKLFWVSQTVGNNRGIEKIIEALGISQTGAELHLLGNVTNDYKQQLRALAQSNGLDKNSLIFYPPKNPDEIPYIAAGFDIGMATETGFCLNNNIAVSNKIFTYIQSGLALAVSNTPGQSGYLKQFPQIGSVYNNVLELADMIQSYHQNRELLFQTKTAAFALGQTTINWENESEKLLTEVDQLLNRS